MDFKLWENGTPMFNEAYGQPEPTLTSYLCGSEERGCVIVMPGGAYCGRAFHEGEPIARMINETGVHAFVLNYRFAPYHNPVEIMDASRAVRYVRYYADKFHIKKDKIAVLGFSAGGHLATMTSLHFDDGIEDGDEIDKVSSRPDAGILCYPVVTFLSEGHDVTRECLLGASKDDQALREYFSGELAVTEKTPPIFIWHTMQDEAVPVTNSLNLCKALKDKNIPCELHIFPYGQHGLGLAPTFPNVAQWTGLVQNWLSMYGF